ncbi:hypothetical protein [Streptomyces sp. NPDC057939]|uniref:hypothetical protein n=1 Tax=Streptomyces sp. NPDC057939 TaxID=3346284 RepID=UPI0036E7DA6A
MPSTTDPAPYPARPAGVPGRALAALVVLAAALVLAFVVAPRTLAARGPDEEFAGQADLVRALREAFVGYWGAGGRDLTPDLERLVDHWFRYHVAKGVIAALLLIVFVVIGALLRKAFLRAGGRGVAGRIALASAGAVASVLVLAAAATVMANVQGAAAPLSSLLSMLPTGGGAGGELGGTLDRIRQHLAAPAGDPTPAALAAMVGDFSRYHAVMAVVAGVVTLVLTVTGVVFWTRFARTPSSEGRPRRVWAAFGVLSVLSALAVLVVCVANVSTAAHPEPALLAFFEGGSL